MLWLKKVVLLSTLMTGAVAFQTTRSPIHYSHTTILGNDLLLHPHVFSPQGDTSERTSHSNSILALQMSSSEPDSNQDNSLDYQSTTAENLFSWLMILLPLISLGFPALLEVARSNPPGSGGQISALTALFASNRIYLYAMSTTMVALAALRGASQDSAALGQRVVDLTEELLYSPPLKGSGNASPLVDIPQSTIVGSSMPAKTSIPEKSTPDYQTSAMIQNLSDELGDSLDEVSSGTQAIVLPVLVSALFASSFFFVKFLNGDNSPVEAGGTDQLAALLQTYGPILSSLWNGLILTLFARCEVRRLGLSNNLLSNDQENAVNAALPWIIGAAITGCAFVGGVWQAQNFVNMALGVLVARAIQINSLPAILGALSLLTLYDATSVLFLPANAAEVSDAIISTSSHVVAATSANGNPDGGGGATLEAAKQSSAMGAVAVTKLTSGSFQPGLLVTKLEGRIGGALGLGDAVFPALLVSLARRFDLENGATTISLFAASMVGYVTGCLACEVVPFLSTTGVPALLLIVPFMVASTFMAAAFQGNLDAFWSFEPAISDDKSIAEE